MKKLIAILLTLAVLCSFGVSALAADTEVTQFTWEKVEKDAAEIDPDGAFGQVGPYCLWLPSFYAAQDLSQERINQGYVANIEAADRSSAILVFTDTNEEKADLETLAKAYADAGMEAEVVKVNGTPAMLYTNTESDTINVMYLEGEDMTLTFSFYPYSDEGFQGLSYVMISSLHPALSWTTYEEAAAKVDPNAQIVDISETGLSMWLPSAFVDNELTEEDVEEGYVAYLTTEDESASVAVYTWGENETIESIMKYYAEEKGDDVAQAVIINGIKAVIAGDEEKDLMLVDFTMDNGKSLEFSFWPASDANFAQIAYLMMASIQAA